MRKLLQSLMQVWAWLSGKKLNLGLALLFLDGGLVAAFGTDVPGLRELGASLAGIGAIHKLQKGE